MSEELPPSIAQTIADFKAMAARYERKHIAGRRDVNHPIDDYEIYRPKRSARGMKNAPEWVIACYCGMTQPSPKPVLIDGTLMYPPIYSIALGGSLWKPEHAKLHWLAGMNPRLLKVLHLDSNGTISSKHCLLGSHLGYKIDWKKIPDDIRERILQRS